MVTAFASYYTSILKAITTKSNVHCEIVCINQFSILVLQLTFNAILIGGYLFLQFSLLAHQKEILIVLNLMHLCKHVHRYIPSMDYFNMYVRYFHSYNFPQKQDKNQKQNCNTTFSGLNQKRTSAYSQCVCNL